MADAIVVITLPINRMLTACDALLPASVVFERYNWDMDLIV